MRYVYSDNATRCIQIDRVGLRAFLVEQGMTREQLQSLTIRFAVMRKVNDCVVNGNKLLPQKIGGLHVGNTITVYTHGKRESSWLNFVLLHELRHHMQIKWNPEQQQYHFVIGDKIITYDGTVPYDQQPWEVDANKFALQHQNKRFLSIADEAETVEQIIPVQAKKQKATLTGPMRWIAIGLGAIASGILIAKDVKDGRDRSSSTGCANTTGSARHNCNR